MWEIAENLHRAELTALERDEHVAEWIGLAEKLTQDVSVSGGRGKEGGIRAASRDLGINREDARRAVHVASLAPDAKEAAREAGLADNRTALLQAAKEPPERQADAIRCKLVVLLAEARIGAELDAAQRRGEVARADGSTHHRPKEGVRTADALPPTHADLGIPRQRAADMKALAKKGEPSIRAHVRDAADGRQGTAGETGRRHPPVSDGPGWCRPRNGAYPAQWSAADIMGTGRSACCVACPPLPYSGGSSPSPRPRTP
jgi:ParB family chromosome partitioning protein